MVRPSEHFMFAFVAQPLKSGLTATALSPILTYPSLILNLWGSTESLLTCFGRSQSRLNCLYCCLHLFNRARFRIIDYTFGCRTATGAGIPLSSLLGLCFKHLLMLLTILFRLPSIFRLIRCGFMLGLLVSI